MRNPLRFCAARRDRLVAGPWRSPFSARSVVALRDRVRRHRKCRLAGCWRSGSGWSSSGPFAACCRHGVVSGAPSTSCRQATMRWPGTSARIGRGSRANRSTAPCSIALPTAWPGRGRSGISAAVPATSPAICATAASPSRPRSLSGARRLPPETRSRHPLRAGRLPSTRCARPCLGRHRRPLLDHPPLAPGGHSDPGRVASGSEAGGLLLLAAHLGEDVRHLDEWWGHRVDVDFTFFQTPSSADTPTARRIEEATEQDPYRT